MKRLKRINFEITNSCNMQCSFCPDVNRTKVFISEDDFRVILGQCAPLTEQVSLHLMGEPTTHPQFGELISIATELDVPVEITTNGLLLKKHKSLFLSKNSIRQINFSLQSFMDNFPERPFIDYIMPLLEFTKELHEKRPEVYINFRLWNLAGDDSSNNEVFSILEEFYETTIKREVDVGGYKSKRIWNRVYLHFDTRFEWPSLDVPFISEQGTCRGLGNHIGIHADGTVVPCCLDKDAVIQLGNCLTNPLSEILDSDRAVGMLEGFKHGKLVEELCKHCSFIQRFKK